MEEERKREERWTLLRNATIATMDAEGRFYRKGFLLVRNDRIVALSSSEEEVLAVLNAAEAQAAAPPEVVELEGKWVLPGLINTHCHTNQQLARGLGDDVDLTTWLHERIWPFESHMTFENCRVSALLCGVEQIRSGVTCFAEAGGQHVEAIAEAVKELGLRGVLSMSVMDTGEGLPEGWKATTTEQVIEQQERLFDQLHETADGRIRMWFNLRTLMNCSDDLVKATQQAADKRGVGIHMHVAEFKFEVDFIQRTRGSPTVTHLHKLGCLSHNLLAVHSVHLRPEELQLYKKNNVKVSHCPAAAMRYLGFPLIPEMIAEGITVGLGTDGAPSNNRMSIVDEMWLANLLHKVRTNDPQVMPSSAVLSMATLQGAKCLLWDNEIGSLEVGKKADLIVINPDTANMLPVHQFALSNLVTAMQSHNVESVMVNGRWLMRDHNILCVDEKAVLAAAKRHAKDIFDRAGLVLP